MEQTVEQKVNSIRKILGFNPKTTLGDVEITPDMAKQLLRFNTNNRKLYKATVAQYAKDMEKGKWQPNASMICFSTEGEISDGQHRLNAIIKAKVPASFVVKLGVDNFAEMDRGKSRTVIDNVSLDKRFKHTEIAENKDVQSVANTLVRILGNGTKVRTERLMRFLEKYGEDLILLKYEGLFSGTLGVNNNATSAALFIAYENGVKLELLKRVRAVLNSGIVSTDKDVPIIALRDKLMQIKGGGQGVEKDRYKLTLYCVSAVERGLTSKYCKASEPKYKLFLEDED